MLLHMASQVPERFGALVLVSGTMYFPEQALANERASVEERAWVERELALRERARLLADRLQLDASDVHHQLKQLQRSPTERLQRGLALGHARPRIAE